MGMVRAFAATLKLIEPISLEKKKQIVGNMFWQNVKGSETTTSTLKEGPSRKVEPNRGNGSCIHVPKRDNCFK